MTHHIVCSCTLCGCFTGHIVSVSIVPVSYPYVGKGSKFVPHIPDVDKLRQCKVSIQLKGHVCSWVLLSYPTPFQPSCRCPNCAVPVKIMRHCNA